jgi:hypothetical protein
VSGSFTFEGFDIPYDLAILTGGGESTWAGISVAHLAAYARYGPISAGHDVLEVGCGVGRDAIPLTRVVGPDGSYVGVAVCEPTITCSAASYVTTGESSHRSSYSGWKACDWRGRRPTSSRSRTLTTKAVASTTSGTPR